MLRVIDSTLSTNDDARRMALDGAPHGAAILAHEQTAGRGQRGNTWESQPGANATFSVVLRPHGVTAVRQFVISQAAALAVADTLGSHGIDARVKWPNDIYVGDRKICGILITCSLTDTLVSHCIVGIGLNVNQRVFVSDAPNPVSMWQLTHTETDPVGMAEEIAGRLSAETFDLSDEAHSRDIAARYMQRLWRRDGSWPYRDTATGEIFEARIEAIAPSGYITLRQADGAARTYEFKQVSAVL